MSQPELKKKKSRFSAFLNKIKMRIAYKVHDACIHNFETRLGFLSPTNLKF